MPSMVDLFKKAQQEREERERREEEERRAKVLAAQREKEEQKRREEEERKKARQARLRLLEESGLAQIFAEIEAELDMIVRKGYNPGEFFVGKSSEKWIPAAYHTRVRSEFGGDTRLVEAHWETSIYGVRVSINEDEGSVTISNYVWIVGGHYNKDSGTRFSADTGWQGLAEELARRLDYGIRNSIEVVSFTGRVKRDEEPRKKFLGIF